MPSYSSVTANGSGRAGSGTRSATPSMARAIASRTDSGQNDDRLSLIRDPRTSVTPQIVSSSTGTSVNSTPKSASNSGSGVVSSRSGVKASVGVSNKSQDLLLTLATLTTEPPLAGRDFTGQRGANSLVNNGRVGANHPAVSRLQNLAGRRR